MVPERNLLIDSFRPAWSRWPFDYFAAMGWEAQDLVSLLVVGLAAVYLVRRGWRYYGSLGRDGRVRCGGCGSCATPKSELRKGQGVRGMGQGEEASGQRSEVRN